MALDLIAGGDRAARHCSPAIAELRRQMSEFGYGKDKVLSTMGRADLDEIGGTLFACYSACEADWTSSRLMTLRRSSTACATSTSSLTSGRRRTG